MPVATGGPLRSFRQFSSHKESQRVVEATNTLRFAQILEQEGDRLTFSVKVKLREGEAIVRLTDPYDTVIWEEEVTGPGEVKRKEWFTAPDGEWRLEIHFLDATGRYTVGVSRR